MESVINFIEMWREADEEDARIGGVDSIPEWEYYDYVESLLMKIGSSIEEHKETDDDTNSDNKI